MEGPGCEQYGAQYGGVVGIAACVVAARSYCVQYLQQMSLQLATHLFDYYTPPPASCPTFTRYVGVFPPCCTTCHVEVNGLPLFDSLTSHIAHIQYSGAKVAQNMIIFRRKGNLLTLNYAVCGLGLLLIPSLPIKYYIDIYLPLTLAEIM